MLSAGQKAREDSLAGCNKFPSNRHLPLQCELRMVLYAIIQDFQYGAFLEK
jgi:hypothetical protein